MYQVCNSLESLKRALLVSLYLVTAAGVCQFRRIDSHLLNGELSEWRIQENHPKPKGAPSG